ncbi:heterokaryon incompatibility protein-domain-containing protein [Phaeosphaeria sp. MPI-PUGE-AT-0046c]|nr:heterokaryon incompatibility protein-domain-containing protein [Phaeosphaeria sp. MPI-PUGE-AT-0046c]
MKCKLSTFNLNSPPPFHALSYVWGDASQTTPIHVNDIELEVIKSLAAALRRLHREVHIDYIWIDALSINQVDLEEKRHQGPLMGTIYSTAKLVIAWLGEGQEEASRDMYKSQKRKTPTFINEMDDRATVCPSGVSSLSALFQTIIRDTSSDEGTCSFIVPDPEIISQFRYSVHALEGLIDACQGWGWPFPQRDDFYAEFPGTFDLFHTHGFSSTGTTSALARLKALLRRVVKAYTFFVTDGGYVGLSHDEVQPGDVICDVFGKYAPLVLRPEDGYFVSLGDCYVYGMMNGQKTQESIEYSHSSSSASGLEGAVQENGSFREFTIR